MEVRQYKNGIMKLRIKCIGLPGCSQSTKGVESSPLVFLSFVAIEVYDYMKHILNIEDYGYILQIFIHSMTWKGQTV